MADPATVGDLLSRNEEALLALEAGLKRGRLQLPAHGLGDETPYSLIDWRRLGQLLRLRSRSSQDKGQASEALDYALRLVRFGRMVEGSQGGIISLLFGRALKSMGLDELRVCLAEAHLGRQELRPVIERLESLRPDGQSFREALQFDYSYMADVVDDPERLYSGEEARFQQDVDRWKILKQFPLLSRYIYQRNATKKLYFNHYRRIASAWDEHCSQIEFPQEEKTKLPGSIWAPNFVGRVMVSIGTPSMWNLLVSKCEAQTEVSATQALIALRAYRADRGELPPSLDTLIPDYLPSVPQDDFDGRPLRYSPTAKLIYSVGKVLRDHRGDSEKDLTFAIPSEPR